MKFKKYTGNPILGPKVENAWESSVATNPAAWYDEEMDEFILIYRAAGHDDKHMVVLGMAKSKDGFHFERCSDEPLFAPLGLDWRYGVAILSSFLAREVFVGTLGTIFGIESADEHMAPLVQQIQNSDLALGSGMALLVFFAIALQCVSTLAILSKESGSGSLAVKMFAGYFLFAYVAAVLVYQLTSLIT